MLGTACPDRATHRVQPVALGFADRVEAPGTGWFSLTYARLDDYAIVPGVLRRNHESRGTLCLDAYNSRTNAADRLYRVPL